MATDRERRVIMELYEEAVLKSLRAGEERRPEGTRAYAAGKVTGLYMAAYILGVTVDDMFALSHNASLTLAAEKTVMNEEEE